MLFLCVIVTGMSLCRYRKRRCIYSSTGVRSVGVGVRVGVWENLVF